MYVNIKNKEQQHYIKHRNFVFEHNADPFNFTRPAGGNIFMFFFCFFFSAKIPIIIREPPPPGIMRAVQQPIIVAQPALAPAV